MFRNRAALFLVILLAAVVSFGTTSTDTQAPDGQPHTAAVGTQMETQYAGVPSYSVMRTENTSLTLTPALTDAFSPLTLRCPPTAGPAGCTVRVVVSSQFSQIPATNTARMNVIMTGPGTFGPASLVNVATANSLWAETNTMQWVKRNVAAGQSTTITVQFQVALDYGFAGYRTMSVDVFSGLL